MPSTTEVTAPLAEAAVMFQEIAAICIEIRRHYDTPGVMGAQARKDAGRLSSLPNKAALAMYHVMNALRRLPDGEEWVRLAKESEGSTCQLTP